MSAQRKGSGTEAKAEEGKGKPKASATKAAGRPSTKQSRLKDPAGGLTAAGRKAFAEKDGSHLRPGVQGPADTPEKMKRKGSFLTRHFTHPRGPMIKDGEPTRLALSAHAWGEPVPKTLAAAQRLAAKGRKLLEQYHKAQDEKSGTKVKRGTKAPSAVKSARKSSTQPAGKSPGKSAEKPSANSRARSAAKTSSGSGAKSARGASTKKSPARPRSRAASQG